MRGEITDLSGSLRRKRTQDEAYAAAHLDEELVEVPLCSVHGQPQTALCLACDRAVCEACAIPGSGLCEGCHTQQKLDEREDLRGSLRWLQEFAEEEGASVLFSPAAVGRSAALGYDLPRKHHPRTGLGWLVMPIGVGTLQLLMANLLMSIGLPLGPLAVALQVALVLPLVAILLRYVRFRMLRNALASKPLGVREAFARLSPRFPELLRLAVLDAGVLLASVLAPVGIGLVVYATLFLNITPLDSLAGLYALGLLGCVLALPFALLAERQAGVLFRRCFPEDAQVGRLRFDVGPRPGAG